MEVHSTSKRRRRLLQRYELSERALLRQSADRARRRNLQNGESGRGIVYYRKPMRIARLQGLCVRGCGCAECLLFK